MTIAADSMVSQIERNFLNWKEKYYSKEGYEKPHIINDLTKEQIQEYKEKGYSIIKNMRFTNNKIKNNVIIYKNPSNLNEDYFLFKLFYIAEKIGYEETKAYLKQQECNPIKAPQLMPCMMKDRQCNMFCEYMREGKCSASIADKDRWLALVEKYHINDWEISHYKRRKRGF